MVLLNREGAVANDVVVLLNRERVVAEGNKEADEEPTGKLWGVELDDPNNEDTGAEVVGVVNREDGAEGGLNSKDPLPDEPDEVAADVCGAADAPGVPELENNPAT